MGEAGWTICRCGDYKCCVYVVGYGRAQAIQWYIGKSIRKLLMQTMQSTQREQTIVNKSREYSSLTNL